MSSSFLPAPAEVGVRVPSSVPALAEHVLSLTSPCNSGHVQPDCTGAQPARGPRPRVVLRLLEVLNRIDHPQLGPVSYSIGR